MEHRKVKPAIYSRYRFFIVCFLLAYVFLGECYMDNPLVGAPRPEDTVFYERIKEITHRIDEEIERIRLATDEEKECHINRYFDLLSKNNLKQIYDGPMSTVYEYTGDLFDLLDVPFIRESIEDKVHRRLTFKRAVNNYRIETDEADLALKIRHPNLILSYFAFEERHLESFFNQGQSILWIVEEFLEFDVEKALKNTLNILPDQEKAKIIQDVGNGLDYLHSMNVMHLDIKETNVLGTYSKKAQRLVYKLIDFGVSLVLNDPTVKEKKLDGFAFGTDPRRPPEIIFGSVHAYSSDIWCLGLLSMMLSSPRDSEQGAAYIGSNAFMQEGIENIKEEKDFSKVYKDFLLNKKRLIIDPRLKLEVINFINKCSERDYRKRTTLKELREHPYMLGECISDPFYTQTPLYTQASF